MLSKAFKKKDQAPSKHAGTSEKPSTEKFVFLCKDSYDMSNVRCNFSEKVEMTSSEACVNPNQQVEFIHQN